jgi:deoxyribonuclease V
LARIRPNGKKYSFSAKKAHEAQIRLSKQIVQEDRLPRRIRFVAGVDVAYFKDLSIGAATVLKYDSMELVESQTALTRTTVPYMPTLLSFREIQPIIQSIRKLNTQPDIFLVDGQGYAHPYRCGLASHLGLVLHKPTIGIAKTRLIGELEETESPDAVTYLENNNETIGAAVTTKQGRKPVYVSIGHMVSLNTAIRITKECTRNSGTPEPLSQAHHAATLEKHTQAQRINKSSKRTMT